MASHQNPFYDAEMDAYLLNMEYEEVDLALITNIIPMDTEDNLSLAVDVVQALQLQDRQQDQLMMGCTVSISVTDQLMCEGYVYKPKQTKRKYPVSTSGYWLRNRKLPSPLPQPSVNKAKLEEEQDCKIVAVVPAPNASLYPLYMLVEKD